MSARIFVRVEEFERIKADHKLRSNYALAKRLGLSQSTVGRVLSGNSLPGIPFIAATISELDVRFDDVFSVEKVDEAKE